MKARLIGAQSGSVAEASELNFIVAKLFAEAVNEFLSIQNIDRNTIDAIGSHGQTLFHSTSRNEGEKSTFQIGSPSIIAEITGILTIGNFRVRDVAAGGAGSVANQPSGDTGRAMNQLGRKRGSMAQFGRGGLTGVSL